MLQPHMHAIADDEKPDAYIHGRGDKRDPAKCLRGVGGPPFKCSFPFLKRSLPDPCLEKDERSDWKKKQIDIP
jgi:hypothetical protein